MGATSLVVMCVLGLPPQGDDVDFRQSSRFLGGLKQIRIPLHQERYDKVPFEGDIDAIIKQLLLRADEDNELAKLFDEMRKDPQFKLSAEQWKDLPAMARNPWLRPQLLDLLRKAKEGGLDSISLDDVENLKKLFENAKDWMNGDWRGPDAKTAMTIEDRFAEWTKDFLKELDETQFGDFLRDSPAWQNALRDLQQTIRAPGAAPDWLKKMPQNLRLPDGWTPRLNDWAPRLGGWTGQLPRLPDLPRWRFSAPSLPGLNLNLGGPPQLAAPSLGSVRFSNNVTWLLALVLLVLLAWLFYQTLGRAPKTANIVRRGPWPVDPSQVTTRRQLVQAFDYVSLLLLGEEVRTWNHVAVAKKLGEEAPHSPAAAALAQLYEWARYTPGDDTLPPDAQAAARRHLLTLAGSAAA